MPATQNTGGTGSAWVQVGVPNFATVDARVDPTKDQRKLGTTFKQPLGGKFAVTLQNNYSLTETNGVPAAAPSDFPLMTAPRVPVTATTPHAPLTPTPTPPQIWGNENVAKFDFLPTGTSFSAGLTTASNDPVTHNKLSADQRLYGPLHVTTAVTDMGQPTESKSITAGVRAELVIIPYAFCPAAAGRKPPSSRLPPAAPPPNSHAAIDPTGERQRNDLRLCRSRP